MSFLKVEMTKISSLVTDGRLLTETSRKKEDSGTENSQLVGDHDEDGEEQFKEDSFSEEVMERKVMEGKEEMRRRLTLLKEKIALQVEFNRICEEKEGLEAEKLELAGL